MTNFLASVALRSISIAILISLSSTQIASGLLFFLFERKLAVFFRLKIPGPFLFVYAGKVIDSSRNARAAEFLSSVTQELRITNTEQVDSGSVDISDSGVENSGEITGKDCS